MKTIFGFVFWAGLSVFLFKTDFPAARAEPALSEEAVLKEVNRLQELRETNPEAYRRVVWEKKERLRRNFQTLRETRPERFRAFLGEEQIHRKKRLEYFRRSHPGAFERFRAQRVRQIHSLARKNPERYEGNFPERIPPLFQPREERWMPSRDRPRKFEPGARGMKRRRAGS